LTIGSKFSRPAARGSKIMPGDHITMAKLTGDHPNAAGPRLPPDFDQLWVLAENNHAPLEDFGNSIGQNQTVGSPPWLAARSLKTTNAQSS
jgi:hypothetical protein